MTVESFCLRMKMWNLLNRLDVVERGQWWWLTKEESNVYVKMEHHLDSNSFLTGVKAIGREHDIVERWENMNGLDRF